MKDLSNWAVFIAGLLLSLLLYKLDARNGKQNDKHEVDHLQIRADEPIEIQLKFSPGWQINPKGASSAKLFLKEVDGKLRIIQEHPVLGSPPVPIPLKPLVESTSYQMDLVIYLCKKGESSVCTVLKKQVGISADPKADSKVTLELQVAEVQSGDKR